MVERPMAAAKRRRMADGSFEIGPRRVHGLGDRLSDGQIRRNRGGKGAPGPVCVPRLDPRSPHLELCVGRAHDVDRETVERKVPPLHHYDAWPELPHPATGPPPLAARTDRRARTDLGPAT